MEYEVKDQVIIEMIRQLNVKKIEKDTGTQEFIEYRKRFNDTVERTIEDLMQIYKLEKERGLYKD